MKTPEEYKKLLWEKYKTINDDEIFDRYIHSLAVSKKALELISRFNLPVDKTKAEIAGILHDYAKFESKKRFYEIVEKYGLDDSYRKMSPKVLHALLGPYIIKEELGLDDEEIFEAIKNHTTGSLNMSLMSEILFLADYTDETRNDEYFQPTKKMSEIDFYKAISLKIKQRLDDRPDLINEEALKMYEKYSQKKLQEE